MQTEMKNHSFYEQRGVGVRWAYEARCHDFTLPKKCLAKKKEQSLVRKAERTRKNHMTSQENIKTQLIFKAKLSRCMQM